MDIRDKITNYLLNKYQPIAIILHGSRASGKNTPSSDWDFFLLIEQGEINATTDEFEGNILDIELVKYPIPNDELIRVFGGNLQNAEIITDNEDRGRAIIKEVTNIYEQGRNLSDKELGNRINFLSRRLKKLEDNTDKPGIFFYHLGVFYDRYHLGVFYDRTIRYWFEIKNNKWSLPPNASIQIIKQEDMEYYSYLEILFSDSTIEEKLKAANTIASSVGKQS